MHVCLGVRALGSQAGVPRCYTIRPGAHGAQSLQGAAPERVFGHSSIYVYRPLAFRAHRVRGVLPRGFLFLICDCCPGLLAFRARRSRPRRGRYRSSHSGGRSFVAPEEPGLPLSLNRDRRPWACALRRRSVFDGRGRWPLLPLADDALEPARSCMLLSTPPPPRAGGVPP